MTAIPPWCAAQVNVGSIQAPTAPRDARGQSCTALANHLPVLTTAAMPTQPTPHKSELKTGPNEGHDYHSHA